MAPKQVSVGVQVELQAKASSMKKLYEDVSNLMANIDPGSTLAKSMSKALGKLRDQVSDFESISGKSFISSSDLTSALNLYKRFYRDINRMNESVQGAGFGSFIHEDSVIQALQKIQDELDNVKSAAEQIKTINIGDAFKVSNKDQKSIKDLQQKFSLKADDDTSVEDARMVALDNLIAKTEEYNKALARQEELSKSQQKIAIQMSQYSNLRKTYLDTKDQRKDYSLGKMYDVIGGMKGNWVTDLYESSFTDLVNSFFQTTKSGQIKFTDFGRDRVEALANLLGIDLSKVSQDAATIQQEVLKALSNTSQSKFKGVISSSKAIVGNMAEYQQAKTAFNTLGISDKDYVALQNQFSSQKTELNNLATTIPVLESLKNDAEALQQQINDLYDTVFGNLQKEELDKRRELHKQQKDIQDLSTQPTKQAMPNIVAAAGQDVSGLGENVERHKAEVRAQQEAENFKANLQSSIKHWMGAQQVITLVKQGIRQAYQDIQGLDKAMTNIAVVTDFNVSDLWGKINEYMTIAQQYGVTTQGVYEVSQLYFQQGLGEAETMELTTETLKMARIAGMDYADAADGMTVAIRGFKMEMEDAARVTDVYSKVAAVTASDSQEIIEAMSKTASSAASVGSGFEETTAMLAVMIEATREAPTNIGSAMKSIISRYGEMTKGMTVDTDGEEIAFNKVDTALQSVGVSIKDATGQFREFDDVIYELAGKWETLDSLSQRYVATVFAGNRQQSRFLALMSNYDRLVEVTEDAQNSEDAGLLQYSKTLDSLETKLNNIKTSFQQFYMDIFNGPVIGAGLEFINNLIKGFNKLGKITSIFNIINIVKGIKQLANIGVNSFSGIGSSLTQSIKNGFSQATLIAFQAGKEHKQAYEAGWNNGAAPTQNQASVFSGKGKALVNMGIIGGGALSAIGSAWSSKNAIAGSITSGIGNVVSGIGSGAIAGASMGSILGPYGAVIGAAVGGVANALGSIPGIIEAFNNRLQEKADQAAEKAEESNIKRAEAREKVRGLEDGIKDLEELGKKRFDSDEDMQAWLDANNALFEKFPELAVKFDEAGNSIVTLTSAEAELTAAREAASKAAKQAAADEYDKATAELAAIKDAGIVYQGMDGIPVTSKISNFVAAATGGYVETDPEYQSALEKYLDSSIDTSEFSILQDIAGQSDESYAASQFFANLLQGSFLKEDIRKDPKKIMAAITEIAQEIFYGQEAGEEFLTALHEYDAKVDAANRYVDATRASKIAAESASVLSGVEEKYEELESANEAIQTYVIDEFSFDDQGNKITGEVDTSEVAKVSQELGDDFTELYTNLFASGKVDEFNELIQKALTGRITESDFKDQIGKLGVASGSAIEEAYLKYVKDNILLSPDDFITALTGKETEGSEEQKYFALRDLVEEDFLTSENRRDVINNEVDFFEAQLEAGKIAAENIDDYIRAYADIIRSFGDNQAWVDIFTSGDLTNLEGIQETEKALQEAGWTGTLDWAALIPPSVINFTTSYENLMDKTITSLEEMSETFDTAAGEMDIKDAQEVAKKLGKDVSIFDNTFFTREGESFFATQEAINLLKEEQTASIQKQAADQLAAIEAARKEINELDTKDGLLDKYGDTAAAAIAWAKENRNLREAATPETMGVYELQYYISEYYNALKNNIISGSEEYINDLTEQLQTTFELQQEGRTAKKAMVQEALTGLNIATDLQEQAYSLLGKLSQDVTTNLDETEYALFDKVFGDGVAEKYLITDGAGGWQIDVTKIEEFRETYKDKFGTFASILLYNSFTTLEEKTENLLSDAASIGEDIGKGKIFDANDLRALFEPILGELGEEVWVKLLNAFLSKNQLDFSQVLTAQGIKEGSESYNAAMSAFAEMSLGFARGVDEQAQDILEAKYDYISNKLSSADIKNLAEGTDEEKAYKAQLVEFAEKTGKWALLTLEQQYNVLDEVLASDTTLTDKERFEKRESERKRLLEESQGQTLVDYGERRDEAYDLIAETGGKGLTPEEVASLESIYGELDKVATLDGWEVALPQANAKVQDALLKYQETVSQNAADGAKDILSAMAEGTLTGAQIQDYFEELDIDIDYITAENLANGTLEGLLESIKTSLADSNIDISDKMDEIMAAIMDAILNSISSGISSLSAGLEGTLGAADYQALVTKYGLTGSSTLTSKGVRLSREDQNILNRKLAYEAKQNGMIEGYGDQLWEVWRDSDNDPFEGYNDLGPAIEEAVKYAESLKDETQEAQDEAWAYVEALQQARHAAMFDEDSVEFAFMEQDATDGLTKNFDKFVDNIDKVKDAFTTFKSGKAIGYQDFYNMMDFMNKFGANGETNSFIKEIEKAGYTYEDFVNTVVAKTDEFGKVDISGVAAEMGISVDAAMKGMAAGMTEGLQQVAQQQIKYLSSLEAMLEALLILESIGSIEFGLSFEIDLNGDGNPESINGWLDLIEKFEKLTPDQQKKATVLLEAKFKDMGEGYHNIFKAIWGDGDTDFLDKAFAGVLDNETYFKAIQAQIKDGNSIIAQIFSKAAQGETFGQGVAEAVLSAFDVSGFKWEDVFSWKEGSITGWSDSFLKAINKDELSSADLMGYIWRTLLGLDPNTISESFTTALSGKEITLDNQTYKISAEKGKYIVHGLDGTKIDLDGEAGEKIKQQIESYIGEQITNLNIDKDGNLTFELLKNLEKQTIDGGKTPVEIKPQWELADGSAGTLTQVLQEQFGAPITIDVPVVVNPVQYDITEIQEKIGTLGKDSPFIVAWQNALNTLKNVVPISATADITWDTLINTTNDVASIIQNNIVQPILIPITATPVITWNNPTISITTFRQLAQAEINKQYELLKIEPEKMEPIEAIFDIAVKIKEVTGLTESDIKTAWDQGQANADGTTKGTTITIGDVTVTIPEINNVEGIDSTKISDFLKDKPIDDVLVFVSILAQLGQGENGASPIEYASVIEEVQKAFTKNSATPVDVETAPTATLGDNTTIGVDEVLSAVSGYVFTPVDVKVPVTISVSLTDKNIFQKELEKYKEKFFGDGFGTFAEDIDLDAFLNDPMTQAFGKFFDSFSGESLFDAIKNSIFGDDSGLKPEDIAMDNFFAEATGEYQKVIESISSLPETISAITTEVDSTTFIEIANALQTAASAAEQLSSHLSNITLPADGGEESPLSTLLNAFNPEGEEMAEVPILAKVNKIELTPLANKPVELTAKITKLDFSGLKKKENEKITPEVDTEKVEEEVKEAEEQLQELDEKEVSPKVGAETTEAEEGFKEVKDGAEEVDDLNPIVEVGIKDNATGPFDKIMADLKEKASQGITIPVNVSGGGLWTGTVNHISGNALAEGNTNNLHQGASLANKTLVGELGPELAVYNGRYHLLGSAGAEFVKLPKDALVFNHLQTRGIMNGQMNGARAKVYGGRAQSVINRMTGSAMATGNVSGPALAGGIGGALEAVRRAKSVWQGLLNSLSAADLLGGGGGGGGGGGNDESLKAHIEDLQEWYNLSRKIADIEQQINTLLAKRENLTDGHEYLKNLRATQALLEDQVNTQADLMRFQEKQLKAQADFINNHDIWSKFLNVDENGLLQYNEGNETNGGKGALKVLQDLNEMSGSQQLKYITKTLGWSYTNTDGEELEDEELVAKFFEELQKQIDDYDALHDTVAETTQTLEELETEINEIEKEIRENEIELSQEIYDIIVDAWKENIDNLKKQNDLIKEANDAYAEGIQKALDAEREEYDNNQAIQEREQLQRQLSLLRRSGGSASEIADLEQQLNETLKDEYFRNQEQALDTIRDANERQVELMEQQVKIQEETLEYQQEQGIIWQKVYEVMQGTDAEILDFMQGNSTEFFEKSSLVQQDMLTEWAKMVGIYNEDKVRDYYTAQAEENINQAWDIERGKGLKDVYDSASKKDRDNWNREYYEQYAKAMMEGATETEALTKAQEELYEHLEEYKKAMEEKAKEEKKKKSGGGGGGSGGSSKSSGTSYNRNVELTDGTKAVVTYAEMMELKKRNLLSKNSKNTRTTAKRTPTPAAKRAVTTSAGPANYRGTLVGEFGTELGVWNDKWHLMGKNGPEMRNDIPSDALIFNHLQTAGILSGQYSNDFFSRKLSDIPNQLNASHTSALSSINSSDESSILNIEPGAVVVQVSQLNDKYDVNELYNDITDRIYSIASQSSGRGVRRR